MTKRPLCAAAFSFAGALTLARYLLPPSAYLAAALVGVAAGLIALSVAYATNNKKIPHTAALVCLALAAGFAWRLGYDALYTAPSVSWDNETAALQAQAESFAVATPYGVKITARVTLPDGAHARAIIFFDETLDIQPGDALSFTGLCTAPAPGTTGDALSYDRTRGVTMRVSRVKAPARTRPAFTALPYWPAHWAHTVRTGLSGALPDRQAVLAGALLTGEKSGLTHAFREAMSDTGTAHTVAVSGLHVSFLVGLILLLVGNRRRAFWVALPVVLLFVAMAGFPASAVRAAVMQGCLLMSYVLGREADGLSALSLALLGIVALNPHAVGDIGLQLSFASALGLILFGNRFASALRNLLPKKLPTVLNRYITGTVAASLSVIVFSQPLVAAHFGTWSLISPLANLLTLWLVSVCFLGSLAVAAISLLWPLAATVLGFLLSPLLVSFEGLVVTLAKIPFASLRMTSPYFLFWGVLAYATLWLYILWPRAEGERHRALVSLGVTTTTLVMAVALSCVQPEPLRIEILDVGQGQAVLLFTPTQTALLDCGGSGPEVSRQVTDMLKSVGRTRIDLLALTHCHTDHAGGVLSLMDMIDVAHVAVPAVDSEGSDLRGVILDTARQHGIPITEIDKTTLWPMGTATLTLYPPLGLTEENEMSMAMLAETGDFDFLLTGDMSGAMERALLRRENLPDIEVLLAGHHGSKLATSNGLLTALTPEVSVISVGQNRYGHPSLETLDRLDAHGVNVFRTDENGRVRIVVGG